MQAPGRLIDMSTNQELPSTMRAIVVSRFGGPEVLEERELPRPEPVPTEVLVKVGAVGVNPTDWKSRTSGGPKLWGDPVIVGYDVAGEVVKIGGGVTTLAVGDRVFGMPWFPRQAGAYAEYVTAPSRQWAKIPAGLSDVDAAALPLAALTAYQALVDTAGLQAGERVLIHAAAGGVGHLAVQIAKARGAHVIGTASAGKHELLRGLGADELVDYRESDFASAVKDVDVVLDTIGGDYVARSLETLRDGGRLVTLLGPQPEAFAAAAARGIDAKWLLVEPDGRAMEAIAQLVGDGKLRALIDRTFPLADAADAHRHGEQDRTTGKIVLTV
jgi:NADPH:quinone reductase-like Zn-dependent oxidoreductase